MANAYEERPATVLAAGKFVGDDRRLDPGVPSGRTFVFMAPRHFQLLRFRAQLFAISSSVQLSQGSKRFVTYKGDNELYGFWRVEDDSWFHDLVGGRGRWVVVRYELVDVRTPTATQLDPALHVTARFPDPTWSERRPGKKEIEALFKQAQPSDASDPFADAELPGARIPNPDAADLGKIPVVCK